MYGIADGVPHLRVENRVLPAGPTVTDVLANAAFYYGLVRALAEESRPVWTRLPFEAAAANFDAACRHGIEAALQWPRRGRRGGTARGARRAARAATSCCRWPAAGLDAWGVEPADRDLYLGVIEERCRRRVNGASWQAETFHRALETGLDRDAALAATTRTVLRADARRRAGAHLAVGAAGAGAAGVRYPRARRPGIMAFCARFPPLFRGLAVPCKALRGLGRGEGRDTAGWLDRRQECRGKAESVADCLLGERPARRTLRNETLLVLALSLGASGVSALISFVGSVTKPGGLKDQAATLNASAAPGRPWLDLAWQLFGIATALVPVALVAHLLLREGAGGLRAIGFDRTQAVARPGRGARRRGGDRQHGLAFYLAARGLGFNLTVVPEALPDVWWKYPGADPLRDPELRPGGGHRRRLSAAQARPVGLDARRPRWWPVRCCAARTTSTRASAASSATW